MSRQVIQILWLLPFAAVGAELRAETRWPDERNAGVFHCHADFDLDQFEPLWEQMAALQQDLMRELRVPPANEPIHLFLFERKATYDDYLALHFPGVPYRRALFIKERGPGMVFAYLNKDFETDVRHESTHALLHASLPVVPLWLDEGLAEYFEVPASERARGNSHLSKVTWAARFGPGTRTRRVGTDWKPCQYGFHAVSTRLVMGPFHVEWSS